VWQTKCDRADADKIFGDITTAVEMNTVLTFLQNETCVEVECDIWQDQLLLWQSRILRHESKDFDSSRKISTESILSDSISTRVEKFRLSRYFPTQFRLESILSDSISTQLTFRLIKISIFFIIFIFFFFIYSSKKQWSNSQQFTSRTMMAPSYQEAGHRWSW
jgi:hypothetical protein